MKATHAYENRLLRAHLKIIIRYCKTVEPEDLEHAKAMLTLIATAAECLFARMDGGPFAS